jgi:hypothetical protein
MRYDAHHAAGKRRRGVLARVHVDDVCAVVGLAVVLALHMHRHGARAVDNRRQHVAGARHADRFRAKLVRRQVLILLGVDDFVRKRNNDLLLEIDGEILLVVGKVQVRHGHVAVLREVEWLLQQFEQLCIGSIKVDVFELAFAIVITEMKVSERQNVSESEFSFKTYASQPSISRI